jgi:peptidoglycan/xylan/chitin deacetylase (PgdA/CDA1 family)
MWLRERGGQGGLVLSRRREYYIGDRRRRRPGRVILGALVIVALIGGATLAVNLPGFPFLPGQSNPPVAVATAPTASDLPPSPGASPAATDHPIATPPASVPPSPPACAAPTNVVPARVVSHGDIHRKEVALTFDDGLNKDNTLQILRILEREKVNATFFPTGTAIDRLPTVWRAIAKANFPIANHTYSHVELAGLCYAAQRDELAHARVTFEKFHIPEFPAMRPPYELFDDTTTVAAAAEGLQVIVLWNVDTRDWQGASAASIRRSALSGGRGSIILLHTFPEATAAALPGIIKGYRARGFTFVTIGQLLGIAGPVPFPETAN